MLKCESVKVGCRGKGGEMRKIPENDKPREKLASFELAKRYLLKPEMKINNTDDVLSLLSNFAVSENF